MKARFKDKDFNKVYGLYSRLTTEQVIKCFTPGSNREHHFKLGYLGLGTPPMRNCILYPIYIAGKEWKRNNPSKVHPEYTKLIIHSYKR